MKQQYNIILSKIDFEIGGIYYCAYEVESPWGSKLFKSYKEAESWFNEMLENLK